jgi:hypothetical protein
MDQKLIRRIIKRNLALLHPSDAIALVESISKELRQLNSIRISNNIPYIPIELERPDLESLK